MFVVMNRLPVNPDYASQFEARFADRAKMVDQMKGFVRNQVLRPTDPQNPYIVLTVWESEADFKAWVESDAFKKGHALSGTLPPETFLGHGKLESFEVFTDSEQG